MKAFAVLMATVSAISIECMDPEAEERMDGRAVGEEISSGPCGELLTAFQSNIGFPLPDFEGVKNSLENE